MSSSVSELLGAVWRRNKDIVIGGLLFIIGVVLVDLFSAEVSGAFIVGVLVSHGLTRYVDWCRWGDSRE